MRYAVSSNRISRIVQSKNSSTPIRRGTQYARLQSELTRLRSVLAHETMMSHLITTEPELFPDPTDQAAADYELDVARSVKMRTVDKLRRIEQALTSLRERSYGICRRCGQEIPYARLNVQPDSIYCVHCQTALEHQGHHRWHPEERASTAT